MSQFGDQYVEVGEGYGPPQQKTSALAVASLICSLIICCPLVTVLGPFLGLAAIVSIGANPETRKGKGLAIAGIIVGLVTTAAGGFGLYLFGNQAWKAANFIQNEVPAAVQSGFAGDEAAFKAVFTSAGANATDAEVQDFVGAAENRYGGFVSARPDESAQTQGAAPGTAQIPMVFEFEGEARSSQVTIAFDPDTWEWKIDSITIEDPDQGDLTFP